METDPLAFNGGADCLFLLQGEGYSMFGNQITGRLKNLYVVNLPHLVVGKERLPTILIA